jgi:hypothetical protein
MSLSQDQRSTSDVHIVRYIPVVTIVNASSKITRSPSQIYNHGGNICGRLLPAAKIIVVCDIRATRCLNARSKSNAYTLVFYPQSPYRRTRESRAVIIWGHVVRSDLCNTPKNQPPDEVLATRPSRRLSPSRGMAQ